MRYPRFPMPKRQARPPKARRTSCVLRFAMNNIRRFGARRLPARYFVLIMTSGMGNQPPPRPAF
ncbi:hypothetical protein TSH58p_00810 (plasmid) [Azospirillum sp. TSH58]|nr:hypothetical protein TSH58p_00810 [Azospirillum sp. TSH58]